MPLIDYQLSFSPFRLADDAADISFATPPPTLFRFAIAISLIIIDTTRCRHY